MEFIVGLLVGALATVTLEKSIQSSKKLKRVFWDEKTHYLFFRYHVHHSTFGLIIMLGALVIGLYNGGVALFLAGFGLAMIIMHTITDKRLVFVEKEKTRS